MRNEVCSFLGPSISQPALPDAPQHLAVLAGTEIVPANNTSLSDTSTTDLSLVPGYHYMPSVVPVTVHGAHNEIALASHNSSDVLASSSGSRKGCMKNRRHIMVLCICLYFGSGLRWLFRKCACLYKQTNSMALNPQANYTD
jgi:hypothetical protein